MAARAPARRRAKQRSALRVEPWRVWVGSRAAESAHRVTARAVTLGVTRDARLQRSARLHRVMLEGHVGPRKHSKRRMKPRSSAGRGRRRERHARATVAALAERLLSVTAPASIRGHAGLDAVKREVVVGVRSTVAHSPVVAIDALALAVARVARRGVGLRDRAVIDPEIRVVTKSVHPRRRIEPPFFEARSQHAVSLGDMAARASRRGSSLLVTARALAHRRQIEPRRERAFTDTTVTVFAAHARARVSLVREAQIRWWNLHASDRQRPRRIEAHMTRVASRRGRRCARRLAALDRVTARAHVFIGQQPIAHAVAARGVAMAALARHAADREVTPMVEPQGNLLGGIDRSRRPTVVAPALPDPRSSTQDARACANAARGADEHRHDQPEPPANHASIAHGCAPITNVA